MTAAQDSPPDHTMETNTPLSTEAAAEALAAVVAEAGELALAMFRAGLRIWPKGDASVVTDADLAADAFLRERLCAIAPDYGWLSEETSDEPDRLGRRRVWVVDPIDGTRSFLRGNDDWAVAAALVEDGRPVAAALHAPASRELFVAAAGRGATRNGVPITASPARPLAGAQIAGPRSMIDRIARGGVSVVAAPRIYSLALRLARVATGEVDASLASANSFDWDLAAADLLVHEAGGTLTSFDGEKPVYNRPEPVHGAVVAAGAAMHPVLLAALGGGSDRTGDSLLPRPMGIAKP